MQFSPVLKKFQLQDFSFALLVPQQTAVQQAYQQQQLLDANTPFPYWAKVWPSAIGLSFFLHQHASYITNKSVLEVAAGLGLPSLVAAKWASTVCCSDYLKAPLAFAKASALHHQLHNINYRLINWANLPHDIETDVLLLSDINYEPAAFVLLFNMITHFLSKQTTIILSTPQRLLAKPFIEQLLPFCKLQQLIDVKENGKSVSIVILVLQA
jgi:predicted nicotinamide N-methyase